MSTINKTFLRVLLAIACCIALAFSLLPQAEAAMRADVVTGKVTLNGQVIDNKNAKYPLLTYSNITYFPMTYHLSRFMGVETDWNNAAKSLNITAGGTQSAYVAETGKAQSGSVSVTPANYKISVNGAPINNREEKYPIFNYGGITYFPLTWAYAVDSFGWSYQWDAENGLRIDTASAPARVPTDPDTGDAALDKALTILNNSYLAGGKYRGTLEGGGKKTSFDAALDVTNCTDAIDVTLTAEPFPFFDGGVSYTGTYMMQYGGLAITPFISYSGTGASPAESGASSEPFYIGKCFVTCQFTGTRSKRITDFKRTAAAGSLETWTLNVFYKDDGFTDHTIELSVDTAKNTVTQLVLRTANYTLTMTPA